MIELISLVLSLLLLQTQPQSLQPAQAMCEIHGRVTDQETGAPIAHAIVHLLARDDVQPETARTNDEGTYVQTQTARTNDEGTYEFTGLTAGEYRLIAGPPEFRASHTEVFRPQNQARGPLRLSPGERRSSVNFVLPRAAAIDVHVVDEGGEPLAAVDVSVREIPSRMHVANLRSTDDRGRLRVFGVPPGRYLVCAERYGMSFSASESVPRERLVRTCYPSATIESEAEPIEFGRSGAGEIEIRVQRRHTFSISGVVIDASGNPVPTAQLGLQTLTSEELTPGYISVAADGRFTIEHVLPGDYALGASFGGPDRRGEPRELEAAFQPVHVESDDVGGIVLAMVRGVDLAGRITLEDSSVKLSQPPDLAPLMVDARLAGDQLPGMGSARDATVAPDRTFVLTGLFGRRVFDVLNVPPGWYVRSIRYRGQDVTDEPVEVKPRDDPSSLEIGLSNRGATVSGLVMDNGAADGARPIQVVMFPADPASWQQSEPTRGDVSANGSFKVGPRRQGTYVAALELDEAFINGADRDLFAKVAKVAERVTLAEDEERSLDLRVVHIP